MALCCVRGCNNRSDRHRKTGIGFHRFPKDPDLRARWMKAVKRKNWVPGVHSVICTKHFSPDQVNATYLSGPKLRANAVPNVFPGYSSYSKPSAPKGHRHQYQHLINPREELLPHSG
ncbi:THAP domain-containing protein 2-like [Anabrus simplex]|uniref:THAP domain-containing protein 2-like n=1 Tax=Anabrus simplex TaxID=316456 RepID=UPI0035A2CBF4